MGYPIDLDEYDEKDLWHEIGRRAKARIFGKCDYCGRPKGEGRPCKFPDRHKGNNDTD